MGELQSILKSIQEMDSPLFPFKSEDPKEGTRAAVLALFSGKTFEESEVLLLKRSSSVLTHPDQVAFPGGGMEPGDQGSLIETALRETHEEVGLSPKGILPLGPLPSIPTVSSGLFVTPIIALASESIRRAPLCLDPAEVAFADWVSVSLLVSSRIEAPRTVRGSSLLLPEFRWQDERMWGMTALIFDLILRRYARIKG